jgi:hypothetical protein
MTDVAIASFHLIEGSGARAVANVTRIGLDRRSLRSASGLVFGSSMGVGRDGRMAHSFHPGRRALFAVWRDDDALDEFLAGHPIARRWRAAGHEAFHVRLRAIDGHGRWHGVDLLDGLEPARAQGGPVVTVTRATIGVQALSGFTRHARALTRTIGQVPGLRTVVGVGDLPILRLGTVAVWDDDAAVTRAMDEWHAHAAAMRAATAAGWFTESMFARFEPYLSCGTWSGADPMRERPRRGQGR